MSWAKLDDHANEHPKLLKAGAKAAWLWACGLMYCNRQPRKTGRIPKLTVGMLYPGLGKREAEQLVSVGLWVDMGDDYEIHDYKPWNPELRDKRVEAGRLGGQRSGETRAAKQTKQTTKQVLREVPKQTEANDRSILDPPHPTPIRDPKAAEVIPSLSGQGEPDTPRVSAAAAPTSFEESLRVPIEDRARLVERDPSLGQWLQAHRWPEVVELATGWGDTRLGQYSQDSGVRAAVALFAIPFTLGELLSAIPRIRKSEWARGKKLGLSCMTPAVVRTALNEPDKPDDGLTREERIELKFAEAKQRRLDEARAAERAARGGACAVPKS